MTSPTRPDGAVARPPFPARILGVSHVVVGVADLDAAQRFLNSIGYFLHGSVDAEANDVAKSPFVSGPLAPTFAMRLMVGPSGYAPLELLHEHRADPGSRKVDARFEAVLGSWAGECAPDAFDHLDSTPAPFSGLRQRFDGGGPAGVGGLVMRCRDLGACLPLWETLGIPHVAITPRIARINIRGALPSNRLTLYAIADGVERAAGYLDRDGVVCLSLWCSDADRLHAELRARGYVPGDCFTAAPMGRDLRVFFMRNASGEVYEFISLATNAMGDVALERRL